MDHVVETEERTFTVEEFLAAYADRPGKFELVDGRVVRVFDPTATGEEGELVNERALHAIVKFRTAMELHRAFEAASAPLILFGDGMSVLTPTGRVRGPDAVAIPAASFVRETRLLSQPPGLPLRGTLADDGEGRPCCQGSRVFRHSDRAGLSHCGPR